MSYNEMKPSKKFVDKLSRLMTNQSEMSRRTGIAQSALSEASSGKRRLYVDQAFLIARVLGVPLDFLADDAQDEPPAELSADEWAVLDLYRAIGLNRQEALRRLSGNPKPMIDITDEVPFRQDVSGPGPGVPGRKSRPGRRGGRRRA